MPARDRTDAVDWSAVEAWLVGSQVIADLGERMGGDPAPAELSHALAAVRLVRALEEGVICEVGSIHPRRKPRFYAELTNEPRYKDPDAETYFDSPLEAVQRALDASKGEG